MPARKPSTLNTRNDTKADRSKRKEGESSMMPKTKLTAIAPMELKGHAHSAATWKRLIGLYLQVDGVIATAFDRDILVKYCLLEEEVVELATMRKTMYSDWKTSQKEAKKTKPDATGIKDFLAMWTVVNGMFERFRGMDARLDGKRKLLMALSQSLYLTPRSRAGVAPPEKPPEKPKSAMGGLLDED